MSKVQADNQIRFQDLEKGLPLDGDTQKLSKKLNSDPNQSLPGSSQPQDLGSLSYKDTSTNEMSQRTQSIDTTASIVTETFQAEEKILPNESPDNQYKFATSFLKVGDYSTAERAFREFVVTNPEHDLAGNAQYWYAETFRIRQLYTDAASAYLEGYQKYPKGEKAPINLLKLGISMVQIGEKDQGCKMIDGVEKQYPKANQSVIQKLNMSLKNLSAKNKIPKLFKDKLNNKRVYKIYKNFEKSLNLNQNFIVAVSGGPDSLALAFLAKVYSIKNKLKAKFFIIDHKLRSNSSQESNKVKSVLKRLSISAEILSWNGKKPTKNIQSLARKKRYELLISKCNYFKINNILLGHHQEDLFENFFYKNFEGERIKRFDIFKQKNTNQ